MCKKLVMVCLVLAMASTAFAEYLVSDFEDGLADGWTNGNGCIGGYKSGYPMYFTDGAVVGTITAGTAGSGAEGDLYSIKVATPETWWDEAASIDLAQLDGGVDAFFANNTVQVTVTFLASEWGIDSGAWCRPGMTLILCGNSAAPQYDVNPLEPGRAWTSVWGNGTQWLPSDGDVTTTILLHYYGGLTKARFATDATVLGITLAPRWIETGSGAAVGGNFYIDSVSLCPEPATMALLGLGGLALIRRKR